MRIRFTPSARAQFLAAVAYIQNEDKAAAQRFRQRAESVLRRLERFPRSGRVLPEFPELPYREVVVTPYRVFYRVERNTVWVIAMWHSAQLRRSPSRGPEGPRQEVSVPVATVSRHATRDTRLV